MSGIRDEVDIGQSFAAVETKITAIEHRVIAAENSVYERLDALRLLVEQIKDGKTDNWAQEWWLDQLQRGHVVQLEYPVLPKLRRPGNEPINSQLCILTNAAKPKILQSLTDLGQYRTNFEAIAIKPSEGASPSWENPWIPALDGMALYAFVANRNPAIYMEIGSGVSTTFVRQAIIDHGLRTKIISVDPFPRSEIDNICDEVIRTPLEECHLTVFNRLSDGDVLFCDNSHRGFQNTDVTVFFTEVVPLIRCRDILIGVHDIFLPYDYPEDWLGRHYNEQYYMIGFLLGGAWETILPAFHCVTDPELRVVVEGIAAIDALKSDNHRPAIYWFTQKAA